MSVAGGGCLGPPARGSLSRGVQNRDEFELGTASATAVWALNIAAASKPLSIIGGHIESLS